MHMAPHVNRAVGSILKEVVATARPVITSGQIVSRLQRAGVPASHACVVQVLRKFQVQGSVVLAQPLGSDEVRVTAVDDLWRQWSRPLPAQPPATWS
jgi:hypothetical protein